MSDVLADTHAIVSGTHRKPVMSRSLTVITILAAVGPAASAPRLKDKPRGDYFPTMVGDRWVIEMRYESSSEEYTELITAVEKTDGGRVISVAREVDGKVDTRLSRVRVTDKGLFRISQNGSEYDAPYCILKRPLEPGDAWKTVASVANGASRMEIEYRVGKEEEVEVPAGSSGPFGSTARGKLAADRFGRCFGMTPGSGS